MDSTSLESFYEEITLQAVTDTVEKLLRYPFGFHADARPSPEGPAATTMTSGTDGT